MWYGWYNVCGVGVFVLCVWVVLGVCNVCVVWLVQGLWCGFECSAGQMQGVVWVCCVRVCVYMGSSFHCIVAGHTLREWHR